MGGTNKNYFGPSWSPIIWDFVLAMRMNLCDSVCMWFVMCCNSIELTMVIKWASVSLSVSAVCDEQVDWCGQLYSCYSLGNCGCAMCGSFYNCIWVSERSSESSEVKAWVQCSWFTTILQRFCVLASCRTWWCFVRRPTFLKDAKDKARGQNQHMAGLL